ncbi:MAG: hypothetical protein Tsb0034_31430 [Ekhidna sp.]
MRKKGLIITILFTLIAGSIHAQEDRYKALFLMKFSEYITWPDDDTHTIGVLGFDPILEDLQKMAKSKEKVEVKRISSTSEIDGCDIVYVADSQEGMFAQVVGTVGSKSILLVTENRKWVGKGADIGFMLVDNKLGFVLNKGSIEAKKMVASSRLLALSR